MSARSVRRTRTTDVTGNWIKAERVQVSAKASLPTGTTSAVDHFERSSEEVPSFVNQMKRPGGNRDQRNR